MDGFCLVWLATGLKKGCEKNNKYFHQIRELVSLTTELSYQKMNLSFTYSYLTDRMPTLESNEYNK